MALVKMETRTETYWIRDKWFVDITISPDKDAHIIEAWLYHKDYGIKDMMYGEAWDDTEKHTIQDKPEYIHTYEQFLAIVESNIPDYMKIYQDEYMD